MAFVTEAFADRRGWKSLHEAADWSEASAGRFGAGVESAVAAYPAIVSGR
ncbi:MAG: hypothetical protein MZV70_68125 [Desulfobacterales bacterium]|nr:hypothetical protein [Desulfobacterales bacterium]